MPTHIDIKMHFDLTNFYSLLQAFDLTGRRVFGSAWNGEEAFARRANDPNATRQERQDILDGIKAQTAQAQQHQVILTLDAGEDLDQSASDSLHGINAELDRLKRRLSGLPHVTDWWVADHEAFARRQRIEDELRAAFAQGDLDLLIAPSEIVQWQSWSRLADFKVYFGLSMVRVPFAHAGRRRRGPAFVSKLALSQWLERFGLPDPAGGELTPQAQLKIWLKEQVRENEPKKYSKASYRNEALAIIPKITARAFDTVWDQTVPKSWRQSGRTRK